MKKVFCILLAVAFFIFLVSILINPVIIFFAKKQLKTIFKGSDVSIGSCRLNPARQLSFFDLSIKKKPAYDFLVKQARAEYSFSSIFKGEILKFSLQEAKIAINLPQKNITEFTQYLNLSPKSAFLVKSLELSDFNLDLKAKDFDVSGVLSCRVNLSGQIMDYLDVKIESLGIQGLNLNNLSLKGTQGSSEGRLGIDQVKYNKLTISGIKSQVRLSGKELSLSGASAQALDGDIEGNLKLSIDRNTSYGAVLKFTNLDIARFIHDFELKEKFEMTGRLSGNLTLQGKGADIEILNGELSTLEPGGMLIVKDTKFLENMASKTNQSLDLLVENFKNYHYNIGTMKLSLDNNNLMLDTALDGETGKRNINIVLHDFRLKKGGQ